MYNLSIDLNHHGQEIPYDILINLIYPGSNFEMVPGAWLKQ